MHKTNHHRTYTNHRPGQWERKTHTEVCLMIATLLAIAPQPSWLAENRALLPLGQTTKESVRTASDALLTCHEVRGEELH